MKITAGAGVSLFTCTKLRTSGMWPSLEPTKNNLQRTEPRCHTRSSAQGDTNSAWMSHGILWKKTFAHFTENTKRHQNDILERNVCFLRHCTLFVLAWWPMFWTFFAVFIVVSWVHSKNNVNQQSCFTESSLAPFQVQLQKCTRMFHWDCVAKGDPWPWKVEDTSNWEKNSDSSCWAQLKNWTATRHASGPGQAHQPLPTWKVAPPHVAAPNNVQCRPPTEFLWLKQVDSAWRHHPPCSCFYDWQVFTPRVE